jgi:hypothetical protein
MRHCAFRLVFFKQKRPQMKKLLVLPLLVAALNSFAGWELMFCDTVNDKGECVGKADAFSLKGTALNFNVLLANTEGLKTVKIYFEVYVVNPATYAEELITTQEITTAKDAKAAFVAISLTKKGNYLIKARDAYKDYITSREVVVN